MRSTFRSPRFSVLLLCLAAACAPAMNEPQPAAPTYGSGMVEVRNDGRQDIVMYAMRDGMRYRLGRVSRMETAALRLPNLGEQSSYQVSLVAEPLGGGRAFASAPLVWHKGQSIMARVGQSAVSHTLDVALR
jgi:hypothetical protein